MPRKPNGASSIYLGGDGYWHGRVTVGLKDNGKTDRRHVQGKTEAEVTRKVRELERARHDGKVRRAGQRWTLESWLTHWINHIAVPPGIRPQSQDSYRVDVDTHLIPHLGAHRLERLTPEHLERFYAAMQTRGSSAGTVNHVHRTVRAALNVAVRRGYLTANPATLAKPPTADPEEVEPYDVDEIKRLFKAASGLPRNSARWVIALALGLRQGEALGLQWSDVDLDRRILRVRRGRQRPRYEHSCETPCGKKAGYCPARRQTRQETSATKSRAGRRTIGVPAQLATLLQQHRADQDRDREKAGDLWTDGDWVFASTIGAPLNPNTDYHQWKALLTAANVRDGRLHDARHTAATVLLILGVPERTVMGIMGWSSTGMTRRYQHVTDGIRQTVADQVDDFLWDGDE